MLTAEDKKWMGELFDQRFVEQNAAIEKRFDERFAEQDKHIDAKFAEQDKRIDAKFAEQDKHIDAKFAAQDKHIDAKFAEQDARIDKKFDERFTEQDKRIDAKFAEQDKRFDKHDKQFQAIRNEMRTQQNSLLRALDKYAEELREEMRAGFAKQEKRTADIIDEKIKASLAPFEEYFPGAYRSYDRLERRVDKIEMRHNVLEQVVMDHVRED